MGRKKQALDEGDPNAWMATFSDLLSLLLTFFVLLFAMKSLDQGKLEQMLGYFRRGGLGILLPGGRMPLTNPDPMALQSPSAKAISPQDIERLLFSKPFKNKIVVSSENRGVVLTVSSGILFPFGAELLPESAAVLDEIIDLIQGGDFLIQITGHTGSQPPKSALYSDNWDLSIARAGRVARYIESKGVIDPKRLSVIGLADTQPLKGKDTNGNTSKHNRVELVLLN